MLGGQGSGCGSGGEEDINFEGHQFGRKSGEPLELPRGISVFNDDVATLDVTEVMEPLAESLSVARIGHQVGRQVAYSSDLVHLLCLGGARRGENTGQRGQQEAAAVHAGR